MGRAKPGAQDWGRCPRGRARARPFAGQAGSSVRTEGPAVARAREPRRMTHPPSLGSRQPSPIGTNIPPMENLVRTDREVAEAIRNETRRQGSQLELIASENFVVRGRPRSAGLASSPTSTPRAIPAGATTAAASSSTSSRTWPSSAPKQLFGADHANVQPHSGSQANTAGLPRRPEAGRHASWA